MCELTRLLKDNIDEEYAKFSGKIVCDTAYPMLGVRLPVIKEIAKKTDLIAAENFMREKHTYYEEFMLHGLMINKFDREKAFLLLEDFLPYIDNWAICDSVATSIKNLAKNKQKLFDFARKNLTSDKPYTVRFAVVILLAYFITDEYVEEANALVLSVNSQNYYINMAIAWYLSVALVKQYDVAIKILRSKTLPKFIQNKTISKARDSYRIDDQKKAYLKTLTI